MIAMLLRRLSARTEQTDHLVQQRAEAGLQHPGVERIATGLGEDERGVRAVQVVHTSSGMDPEEGQVTPGPSPLCTCGHAWVNHGDRAIAACDAGYIGHAPRAGDPPRSLSRTGPRSLCHCTGWERAS